MFELVVIALASMLAAVLLVWLFRRLTAFRGTSVVSVSGNRNRRVLTRQQGYLSRTGGDRGRRAGRKARSDETSKPWGW